MQILYDSQTIQQRIAQLAAQINSNYMGLELYVIGVLKGCFMFQAELIKQLTIPVRVDFMQASSYGNTTQSSGNVRILKDLDYNITNKHVLIVEDIIDSGLTLQSILEILAARKPASMQTASLLAKPSKYKSDIRIQYCGFEIDDYFVVGMGMDYQGLYRNLDHIAIMQ